MIEVPITKEMLKKAKRKAKLLGVLRNSQLKGKGNIAGFLGEEIVLTALGGKSVNTYDYDILIGRHKIEVKTKRCSVEPRPDYAVDIHASSAHQKCDWYIFVRVLKNYTKGWIVGKIRKEDFFKKAKLLKAGTIVGSNKMKLRRDNYEMYIDDLIPVKVVKR